MCCERLWLHLKISLHFLFINAKLLHHWTQKTYTVFKAPSVLKLKHFDNRNHKQKYFVSLYCGQLYQLEDHAGVFRYPRTSYDNNAWRLTLWIALNNYIWHSLSPGMVKNFYPSPKRLIWLLGPSRLLSNG